MSLLESLPLAPGESIEPHYIGGPTENTQKLSHLKFKKVVRLSTNHLGGKGRLERNHA
ncbi:MAG: hypothetical protein ABEK50_04135 [bacterium]